VVTASVRIAGLSVLLLVGCKPNLDQTVSIIESPIVLAVRSDPPEGAPASPVQFTALYVDDTGPVVQAPLDWAFCSARDPLANLGPVNPKCLEKAGTWLAPLGVGVQVHGKLPDDGCRQFGPDVPEPLPGQPPGRPVDPDSTGGYYQPVRYLAPGNTGVYVGIAETRLSCNLAGAFGGEAVAFAKRYHGNANPNAASLELSLDDDASAGVVLPSAADGGVTNTVPVGAHVSLRVGWTACPLQDACGDHVCGPDETVQSCLSDCGNPTGCTGAERFAAFDLGSQSVVDRREAMAIAWFATAGTFDHDRTGREATDATNTSDNGWRAPAQPSLVHLWVVLRDDRGGVGWGEYRLDVR
jgi:hypothetical protein